MAWWSNKKKKKPSPPSAVVPGQVYHCADPRDWSGGVGGEHIIVVLADLGNGKWRCAVVESDPDDPIIQVNEPNIGRGIYGAIALPTCTRSSGRLGQYVGPLGSNRGARYDEQLAEAELARAPKQQPKALQQQQAVKRLPPPPSASSAPAAAAPQQAQSTGSDDDE